MISIVRHKCGIPINDIFFSDSPRSRQKDSLVRFFVQAKLPGDGFTQFKTQVINLRNDAGVRFGSLSSNTRYKIRRAEREGYTPLLAREPTSEDIRAFCNFFNPFAAHKKLSAANVSKLQALRTNNNLLLSSIKDRQGNTVAMHAYVVDCELERVRLLYSGSHFRTSACSEDRNSIGRANRMLHWYEIETLSKAGFSTYDLGGIPVTDSDPEKNAIARFKSEFGGSHITEFNGIVASNRLLQHGLHVLRRYTT